MTWCGARPWLFVRADGGPRDQRRAAAGPTRSPPCMRDRARVGTAGLYGLDHRVQGGGVAQ